jgi:hypothetical protein
MELMPSAPLTPMRVISSMPTTCMNLFPVSHIDRLSHRKYGTIELENPHILGNMLRNVTTQRRDLSQIRRDGRIGSPTRGTIMVHSLSNRLTSIGTVPR